MQCRWFTSLLGLALLCGVACASSALAVTATVGPGASIMFVVSNSASLDAQDVPKKALMESWGYTVVPITDTATQAAYDAAALAASVAYISETAGSGNVASKLTGATIGVITEEPAISDELGFASSMTGYNDTQINITNTTHYITSTLVSGNQALYSSTQPMRYLSGTQGGYTTLGKQISTANVILAVMERGATLTPSGTAAGRRVFLPYGWGGCDFNQMTAIGLTIMKRSVEWCLLPVAWYKLDDASGTTAADSVGGYTGTLTGPTWTTGKISGGLNFNGTSDYVTIANASAFQVTKALTVTAWIKQTAAFPTSSTVCTILRKGDANPNNWQLCIGNGKVELVLDCGDADGSGTDGGTVLTTNKWYHVAGTWDGTNARVYVGGVLDCTPKAKAAPIGTDTRPVYLGGRTGSTDITTGVVDDVRFYNRCLTAAEISAMAKVSPTMTSWENVAP